MPNRNAVQSVSRTTKKMKEDIRKVAFALAGDEIIKEAIDDWKKAVENITYLSEQDLARFFGNTSPRAVSIQEAERLLRWVSFHTLFTSRAEALYNEHLTGRIPKKTSAWALELWKTDNAINIGQWDQWDPVKARFAFQANNLRSYGTRMSLCIIHRRGMNDTLKQGNTMVGDN